MDEMVEEVNLESVFELGNEYNLGFKELMKILEDEKYNAIEIWGSGDRDLNLIQKIKVCGELYKIGKKIGHVA